VVSLKDESSQLKIVQATINGVLSLRKYYTMDLEVLSHGCLQETQVVNYVTPSMTHLSFAITFEA